MNIGMMLEICAREMTGMPDDWCLYHLNALPHSEPTKVYEVAGAIAPLIQRGPSKGSPNWRKMDKQTRREVWITPEELKLFSAEWEARTGKCSECMGKGEVFASWSEREGSKYRPCDRCTGTGCK